MDYIREFALFKSKSKSLSEELKKNSDITIRKVDSSLLKEDTIDLSYKGEEFTLHFKKIYILFFHKGQESFGFQGSIKILDDVEELSRSVIDTIKEILNKDKSKKEKKDELVDFFNELTKEEIKDLLVNIEDLNIIEKISIEKTDQYETKYEDEYRDCIGWKITFNMNQKYKMKSRLNSERVSEYGSFISLVSEFMNRIESGWEVEVSFEDYVVRIVKSIPRTV